MTESDQMKSYDARNGFTGKTLTNSQFSDAWAITEIIHDSINKTGRFAEKLGDFAHAYSRTEKFDPMRAEVIIRDLFKERFGQTMNQQRQALMEREAKLPDTAKAEALRQAKRVKDIIVDGETKPFYRALDHAGYTLAEHLGITETGAKDLMRDAYREAEDRDLYEDGKAWEKEFHLPKRETERQARDAAKQDVEAAPKKARARTRA
jgi:hypothetical protein